MLYIDGVRRSIQFCAVRLLLMFGVSGCVRESGDLVDCFPCIRMIEKCGSRVVWSAVL